MNEATQSGASAEKAGAPDTSKEAPVNPRDAVLDSMDEQINADRVQQQQGYLEEAAIEMAVAPPPAEPSQAADGAQSIAPMHVPADPVPAESLPEELKDHSLAEYITMKDGVPMMRAKVNGADTLIPMDRVQTQLQKHEAAEVSLQNASELKKQLAFREEQIRLNETALQTRINELASPPPVQPDVDDGTLLEEAKEVVSTMFQGDENEAAVKLVSVLKRSRVPVTPAPAIDTTQIANQAAAAAVNIMTEQDIQKDALTGYTQFGKDYPDIMSDPNLYNMADGMTDTIKVEHPDWAPSEIMNESGKRTMEWLARQRGETLGTGNLPPSPPADNDPNRNARKDGLVRIPQPALGAQQLTGSDDDASDTPQSVMQEIRESRGQPV